MRPHRMDGVSLSFGLIFVGIAAWWAVSQVVTVRLPGLGWMAAMVLIAFGVFGLLGAIRSGRRTDEVAAPVAAEAAVETPGDLPPQMHADIVRELLDNPAGRIDLEPGASPADRMQSGTAPADRMQSGTTPGEPPRRDEG